MIVFVGPTLPLEDCRAILPDAEFLPPASQGDVYRASLRHPFAIGLIDGYFEQVPAVWHKEVLWALSQGIHVFGSASMGALRAAELHAFGMRGVGEIFAAYADGTLEDDDEVALLHGPAELRYVPLSEPMVNIRATLAAAAWSGAISEALRDRLTAAAKARHYPERTYERLLEDADGIPPAEYEGLRVCVENNRVNLKRQDAIAMLEAMGQAAEHRMAPPSPSFVFEATALWLELIRAAHEVAPASADRERPLLAEDFIARFKAQGHLTRDMMEAIMARVLALDESRRHGFVITDEILELTILEFRRRHDLLQSEDLDAWLERNDLDLTRFLRLIEDDARLAWSRSLLASEIEAALPDHLRASGLYPQLKQLS